MTDLTAWALAAVLAVLVLAVAVLAVIGLRSNDDDSTGETERACDFGERPASDDVFVDPTVTVHRVRPESERAGWPRVADPRCWPGNGTPASRIGGQP